MHAEIRQVGNSKGVILPRSILKQCHFETKIDMEVLEEGLLIKPVSEKRAGWKETFLAAKLKDGSETKEWLSFTNESDDREWVW